MIVALQLVSIQTLEKHLTTTRSINERTLKSSELNYSPSPDQGEFETMTITTANRADQTNGQPAPIIHSRYTVFVRNWWRHVPEVVNAIDPSLSGKEPDPGARRYKIGEFDTEEEAIAFAQEYNETHDPGFLSRKAEYTDSRNY